MTILITNDFRRRGAKTSGDEGFGTGGDEDSVVVKYQTMINDSFYSAVFFYITCITHVISTQLVSRSLLSKEKTISIIKRQGARRLPKVQCRPNVSCLRQPLFSNWSCWHITVPFALSSFSLIIESKWNSFTHFVSFSVTLALNSHQIFFWSKSSENCFWTLHV